MTSKLNIENFIEEKNKLFDNKKITLKKIAKNNIYQLAKLNSGIKYSNDISNENFTKSIFGIYGKIFGIYFNDKLIGFIWFELFNGNTMYIYNFMIDKKYQKK